MIATIISILSSAGFGTVFGGIMGFFNRKTDLVYKRLEYEEKAKERAHELEQRKIDIDLMKQELAGKIKVAEIEGEALSEAAAYKAMSDSYKFAAPDKASKMAAFSSFVRPALSLSYFVFSSVCVSWVLYYAFCVYDLKFTETELLKLVFFVIEWVSFMASTTIGYWFATRAGKPPVFRG